MRDILSDDLKQVEKRYNRQLDNIVIDNEQLALKFKTKIRDLEKLNEQYRTLQVISSKNTEIHFGFFRKHSIDYFFEIFFFHIGAVRFIATGKKSVGTKIRR